MHKKIKRIVAFLLDFMVVTFISGTLTMTPLNPNYDAIVDLQSEFETKSDEISDKIRDLDDEKSAKEYDNYFVYYRDTLQKINRMSIYDDIITVFVVFLYVVVFSYFFDGETVGKRIMRLRVVDKSDSKATMWQLIVRSALVYSIPFTVLNVIFAYVLNSNGFHSSYMVMYILSNILEIAIFVTVLFSKENRGVHDLIANTKVIEVERK